METSNDLRCFELKISNMRSTGRVSFAGGDRIGRTEGEEWVVGGRGEFKVGAKTAASRPNRRP